MVHNSQHEILLFTQLAYSLISVSLITQSCPTLCNPMDCSTPGFPVPHQFSDLTQTHAHWVSDGIQSSHSISVIHFINYTWTTLWQILQCHYTKFVIQSYSGVIFISFSFFFSCHLIWTEKLSGNYFREPGNWAFHNKTLPCLILEKGMTTHSSILAWRLPMARGA